DSYLHSSPTRRSSDLHPLLCREPRHASLFPAAPAEEHAEEQLLLDGDALAQGKPFFRLGATQHSPDHRLFAWLADEAGSELYTRSEEHTSELQSPDHL